MGSARDVTIITVHRIFRKSWGWRTQVVQRRVPLHIQAARVAGVEIPNQKRVEYALQYIYGIGPTTAKAILADTVRLPTHHPCPGANIVLEMKWKGCFDGEGEARGVVYCHCYRVPGFLPSPSPVGCGRPVQSSG